ncbi:sugar kinase [Aneurinibacillus sp. REN35]|uniref:sugar kinase n=1 Tax=Aneurinibacillus sp. REN35 TaxID=3237286 RepID=UPI0035285D09
MSGVNIDAKVVTLGETMVSFQTPQDGRIQYMPYLAKTLAGAESNVAIGLTRLGVKTRWISRLGVDPFGDYIQSVLKGEDVDVAVIRDKEHPTGIMFKEINGELDPTIYYYRKHSAASQWNASEITEEIFAGAELFHFTGITPALSPQARECIFHAVHLAKKQGIKISFDPNMRYKLWGEKEARETFLELAKLSDLILPGLDEGKLITGETEPDRIAQSLLRLGPKYVVMKLGARGSVLYTTTEHGELEKISEPGVEVKRVVDSVGAGDGFAAGFLSSFIEKQSLQQCLRRGNVVGALVTQFKGDWENLPTKERMREFCGDGDLKTR